MKEIAVSLFCSAVRPKLWKDYLNSLKSTTVSYEVIFSGFNTPEQVDPFLKEYPELTYIHTANIKPNQNYCIASRVCQGKTISWSCDDATYPDDVIGKSYRYWESCNNDKLILSIQTKETGYENAKGSLFPMEDHCFYGRMKNTPLMAPMNLMSRKFFNNLGGYDRRYIAGQSENDLLMRAYQNGAKVEIFGGEDCFIDIDHLGKSLAIGESKTEEDFIHRPFAKGYINDRNVLETSWTTFDPVAAFKALQAGERPHSLRTVSPYQLDKFEPYEDTDILTKSQSNNLTDRWV